MKNFTYQTALIVDDSTIDNLIHQKILPNYGFVETVNSVTSVKDGIAYLEARLAEGPEHLPELIFLDIRMPEQNGFDFLRIYSGLSPVIQERCQVYMLSSSLDPVDHERIAAFTFVKKFLSKPLTRQILHEALVGNVEEEVLKH